MFLLANATGVQIYSCNATAAGPVWQFVAPRADLFDKNGKLIIKHFGGPTWQFNDGSAVGRPARAARSASTPRPSRGCCSSARRRPRARTAATGSPARRSSSASRRGAASRPPPRSATP